MAADKNIDRLDREILRLISVDASLSLADIAAKVGLTPTPCWKRIRRMEQDGIAFWVDQAKGRHTLVFGDHYSSYDRAPEEEVRYAEGSAAMDHITEWRRSFAFTPGKRAARDWNWLSMQAPGAEQRSFAEVFRAFPTGVIKTRYRRLTTSSLFKKTRPNSPTACVRQPTGLTPENPLFFIATETRRLIPTAE